MQVLCWLLIACGIMFCKDMLEQEIDLTIQLIQKFENKIENLEEIRVLNIAHKLMLYNDSKYKTFR